MELKDEIEEAKEWRSIDGKRGIPCSLGRYAGKMTEITFVIDKTADFDINIFKDRLANIGYDIG